jgi:hypothetical protein
MPGHVFVNQAARETLSATLTPSTAAGGAEGDRCIGSPAAIGGGDKHLLDAVKLFQLALRCGDARATAALTTGRLTCGRASARGQCGAATQRGIIDPVPLRPAPR